MTMSDTTEEPVAVPCPRCGSRETHFQATARKTGVVVGGIAGAIIAAGISGAKAGAVGGAAIARVISRDPATTTWAAIIGTLTGFCWGALIGHAVGTEVDETIIRLRRCLACGSEFGA